MSQADACTYCMGSVVLILYRTYLYSSYFGNIYFLFNVENLAGLSWRGNSAVGGIGGICQDRAKFKNDGKVNLVLK